MIELEKRAFAIVQNERYSAQKKVDDTLSKLREDDTYKRLEGERDILSFQMARAKALNENYQEAEKKLTIANEELTKRLTELGYTSAQLSPSYKCKICSDTGMVKEDNCSCIKKHIFTMLREQNDIILTDIDSFDKVDLKIINKDFLPYYKKCYKGLESFAKKFPNNLYQIIGLFGAVGTGKTFALSVLANAVMKKGFSVYMLNAQQLNRIFLNYHLARLEQKNQIFRPLLEADLLIIDDLGAESKLNNVTSEYLYTLLTERHNKPIAITSNLTPELLSEKYGQRVFSRFFDKSKSFYFLLDGEDLRIK